MACSFDIPLTRDPEEVMRLAGEAITRAGGQVQTTGGISQFSLSPGIGSVRGTFSASGSALRVEVTHKPALISCSRIEKEIRKRLGN